MKNFDFILFNKECWITLGCYWRFKDEDNDFFFNFSTFDFCITRNSISIVLFNFSIQFGMWR